MKLTAERINAEKSGTKRRYLSDERGLLLEIHPNGKKYWVVRYHHEKKEARKYLGKYPDIKISEAREKATQIKAQGERGEFKKTTTAEQSEKITFKAIAEEWYTAKVLKKSPGHHKKVRCRLDKHILPAIGGMELPNIRPSKVLELCRKLENEQTDEETGEKIPPRPDTAHRVKQVISQVFRFASATDKIGIGDPTAMLKGALEPHKQKHYATITKEAEIATLMRAMNNYNGSKTVRLALLFSALTFCRPGEIRHAEWTEVDFMTQEWRIPAEKMKMKQVHIVPLSSWAMYIIQELSKETMKNGNKWIFPSERNDGRPMSENTIRTALRALGYSNAQMTPHGFRAMASTNLNEQGYRADVIERQLAHGDRNTVRSAYNHADYLEERREMMQKWAFYLSDLMLDTKNKEADEVAEVL